MTTLLERLRRAVAPHFTVERELASGGMGTVFLGHETVLDRTVAIKVLHPEYATARAAERFLREARTLANLRHPNIVKVLQAPPEKEGLFFYILEYLEGETLADRLSRGRLPPDEAVRVGRDLLSALELAHAHGVVHRDIKPSNIFLGDQGVILTDFGIAKSLTDQRTALTAPGQPVGTVLYMPPEQAAGGEITPRTDLYALAMVLYEAITGRMWSIVGPPETVDWSYVPRRTALALRRALAWSPEDRWPDAGMFKRALWARRTPSPATALMWVVTVGAVATAIAYIGGCPTPRGPPPADLAVEPFVMEGVADQSPGSDLALLAANNLQAFKRLRVVPPNYVISWVEGGRVGPPPKSRHLAGGRVRRRGDSLIADVVVRDTAGGVVGDERVAGRAGDKWSLGDGITFALIRILRPKDAEQYPGAPNQPRSVAALDEYLDGETAFRNDAWRPAEVHFQQAYELDSSYARAAWRLWNVQRWRRIPVTVDLRRLLQDHGTRLYELDRLLIEAELAPFGTPRLAKYQRALEEFPYDGTAPLLYGAELFHRGPLSGIPLDSGIAMLEEAVRRDPSLAPAHDQLVWGLIRLGERQAARAALDRLQRNVVNRQERDVDPRVLELAFAARFDPAGFPVLLQGAAGQGQSKLLEMVRLGLSLDIPDAQLRIGTLAAGAGLPPPVRASGYTAQGLAELVLGRPSRALAKLDSAALISSSTTASLQAAQWRVIPAALGLSWIPEAEVALGRTVLRRLSADSRIGRRAAWTLALDAFGAADTTAARPWRAQLGDGVIGRADSDVQRLDWLLEALQRAARGRLRDALSVSARLLAEDERMRLGDPFARAVLHLKRAEWYDSLGDQAAAHRERRWQENSDFDGWLNDTIQAAEVDWSLGLHARWRGGIDAIDQGDPAHGCKQLRRVLEIWSQPEPAFGPLVDAAQRALRGCPG